MAQNKVFVSPGVYTSETDLTFVTRQIGVTTLGLAGETVKGPAFQPIFISNFDEFRTFFGGLDATQFVTTGYQKYELPYIAKSYLSQSNQLYVTRVLGLSGYDAGRAWGITLDAAMDVSTQGITASGNSYGSLFEYTATTAGTISQITSTDPVIQQMIDDDNSDFLGTISTLGSAQTGDSVSSTIIMYKIPGTDNFTGMSYNGVVTNVGAISGGVTGSTSGLTNWYSGSSYSDVENKIVAILRSRGRYDGNEILHYELSGDTIGFSSTGTTVETDPLGNFKLTGTAETIGAFEYVLSFDKRKRSYITNVLGRTEKDNSTAVYVESIFTNMFDDMITDDKVRGINTTLIYYGTSFKDYLEEFQPAVTPYVVSEVRGNKVMRLFRLWTISDGNHANHEFKISIQNIKLDEKEFDLVIRKYYDTDAKPQYLEKFAKCNMNPTSPNYIGRRVGTTDGNFPAKSKYVLVEAAPESNTADAFPAGFLGVPVKDFTENGNTTVQAPNIEYKAAYGLWDNKRKFYLGLTNTKGIDQDFFDYNGLPDSTTINQWTGTTKGFHMDVDARNCTIDGVDIIIDNSGTTFTPTFEFVTGILEFKSELGVMNTDYEKNYSRKFTFAPYGGFDGWDIFRDRRTNEDTYRINGTRGSLGLTNGNFSNYPLTNGDNGITSDYYAYLEAIRTFANPEAVNINIFATPGIDTFDNTNLVEETIEMIEEDRCDSLYITTTPDVDSSGTILTEDDVVDRLDGEFDSNYTATYWPWIQINDAENNVYVWVPPTRDVVRNVALTDNIAFPWFAVAGIQRGDVNAIQVRKKLTEVNRDILYEGRVNPLAYYATDGIKIWGNKTLQVNDTALNRINVRRLLLQTRKLVSAVAIRLLFEQNDDVVRNQFLTLVNPILNNIRAQRGLTDFRVQLDDSPESIDRNELCGKIYIKPTRSLEYICVDFVLTNTGASFDDI